MNASRLVEKSRTHGKGNKNYKTIVCTRYASGFCEYDDECWFIHDQGQGQHRPTVASAFPTTSSAIFFTPTPSSTRPSAHDTEGPAPSLPRLIIPSTSPHIASAAGAPKRAQPCFAFQRNACLKGDLCSYRHDTTSPPKSSPPPTSSSTPSSRAMSDRGRTSGKQPCFDLMRTGICPKGESCIFSHEDIGRYIQWFRDVDCKLYPQGKCKHGDTCLFRHASPASSPDPAPAPVLHRPQARRLFDPYQNEDRACPFSTDNMICANRDMCYVHGFPAASHLAPPSPPRLYSSSASGLRMPVSDPFAPSPASAYSHPPSSYRYPLYERHARSDSAGSFEELGSFSASSSLSSYPPSLSSPSSFESQLSRLSLSTPNSAGSYRDEFMMDYNSRKNVDDPLGIMRCIDDSDDEYLVYEAAPYRR
ncbi:hypothetical protein DL93DRAFT_2167690 [Clavulina sp. PMI_390]|nr:hypothetical protein DL93DRAFT_2167690 [Clavulina sp. PMI_390]